MDQSHIQTHTPLSTTPYTPRSSKGFTLMEVIVSTSIFAAVITMMLVLFNYTLRIQRQTEALRQVSQSMRNFVEFLAKEIRNGQIDYGVKDGQFASSTITPCPAAPSSSGIPTGAATYYSGGSPITDKLGLYNVDGEHECIYWDNNSASPTYQSVLLAKDVPYGAVSPNIVTERVNPPNVKVDYLRFYVRPQKDPYMDLPTPGSSLIEVQPMVTIVLHASVTLPTGEVKAVSYQTSVSTNMYNIPNQ